MISFAQIPLQHLNLNHAAEYAAVPWSASKTCRSFSGSIRELCNLSHNFQLDL